jgi:lysophospholipid hydrolase
MSSFNGYSLINEVSTGGTISSLFSILSLFTEDIKLSAMPTEEPEEPYLRRSSRANSDVSQLDSKEMGGFNFSPMEMSPVDGEPFPPMDGVVTGRPRSSSISTAEGTSRPTSWSPPPDAKAAASQPVTTSHSPSLGPTQRPPLLPRKMKVDVGRGTPNSGRPRMGTPQLEEAMKGSIARAKVDSTLAVIPAEAFRKLTRKYPRATGSIVQVVLERFSRVTFMTAHKFLGLTREILRSEATLNNLVSYPLPRSFYTGGGMQALRNRFQVSTEVRPSPFSRQNSKIDESPSPTIRSPSLASKPTTPVPKVADLPNLRMTSDSEDIGDLSMSPTSHNHPSTLIRRTSAMRKQVAAGDLALDSAAVSGDAYYRPPVTTPGIFSRTPTWRSRLSSTTDFQRVDSDDEDDEELREALVSCIAKSIGLFQAPEQPADSRHSVSATHSTPNSPPMFPNGRGQRQNVGNVLDLMNTISAQSNNVSGLLRESLMHAHIDLDDQSSISASIQDSFGGAPDVNSKILRDLGNHMEVLFFKKGASVVKEGQRATGLYYVIDGFLDVSIPQRRVDEEGKFETASQTTPLWSGKSEDLSPHATSPMSHQFHKDDDDDQLFTVKPGGLAGYLASLCSTESYVNIVAKTDCFVGFIPQHALDHIVERRPIVLLTLAKRLLSLLSPQVLHIDAGLDWIQLSAGQVLFERGEPSTDFYVVINGRLRSVQKKPNSESVEVLREFGQGDSVGELDAITGAARSTTVQAIRETEIVRMPSALFEAISVRHPETTLQFMRAIATKVRSAVGEHHGHMATEVRAADRNLKTVCILGNNRSVPVAKFAGKLKASLEELGSTTSCLDLATVMRKLGRHAFTRMGWVRH